LKQILEMEEKKMCGMYKYPTRACKAYKMSNKHRSGGFLRGS